MTTSFAPSSSTHYTRALAFLLLIGLAVSGCTSYEDSEWVVHPGEASDSIAVEAGSDDTVCVRDPDTGERTCVPRLDTESGR